MNDVIEFPEVRKRAKLYALTVRVTKNSFGYSATIFDKLTKNSTKHNVYLDNPATKDFLARLKAFRETYRGSSVFFSGVRIYGLTN